MTSSATATPPRSGRPRSAQADQAILDAALEQFADLGFDGLSVEGVAEGAGVSKTTIYRRYGSKTALVLAACERVCHEVSPAPDTGSLRGDLEAILANLCRLLSTTVAGRAVPQLVSESARIPDLADAYHAFAAQRREKCRIALRRGIERGEARADLDVEPAADLVAAPVFYRHLVTGAPLDARFRRAHLENVLRALSP
jgi:AcrR family transcriptional regulator